MSKKRNRESTVQDVEDNKSVYCSKCGQQMLDKENCPNQGCANYNKKEPAKGSIADDVLDAPIDLENDNTV